MTDSVDPAQTPQNAVSDLGRHCLLTPVPILMVHAVCKTNGLL